MKFLDLNISDLSKNGFIDTLMSFGHNKNEIKKIFYVNAHCINMALKNSDYRDILRRADLIFPDGMSVVWASRILGAPLKERVNSTEVFDAFCVNVIKEHMSIYLFGAEGRVIDNAVTKLRNKYPGLNIAGYHHGYCSTDENNRIIEEINRVKPDFLIVGMGAPKQEMWISANLDRLEVGVCWAVGSLFDYLGGKIIQPPLWIRRCGLEWSSRLLQEPGRLWRRYLIGNAMFIFLVLREFLKNTGRSKIYSIIKRFMDICAGMIVLIISLPFLIIASVLIKLESAGPAIFTQKRVGMNGKEFFMYKFRTMVKDAPPYEFKMKRNDPRITKRMGRFLRDTGLDELPQVWNVLKGEMSLVGPRPEMPFIAYKYTEKERERLMVKPGITGLWQISGKTEEPITSHLEYDLDYIKKRSLILDFMIILKTLSLLSGSFFIRPLVNQKG